MVKLLISVPEDLLERIDRRSAAAGTNRSRFLQEAARRQSGWPDEEVIESALERGRKALAPAGRFESADLIRRERQARDLAIG